MHSGGWRDVLPLLPEVVRNSLAAWDARLPVEEIRVRAGRPALVQLTTGERLVGSRTVTAADCQRALQLCCENSVYAWQDALRAGFITVSGGHRVGVAGRVVLAAGQVETIQPVTALNYRIGRCVAGAADAILSAVIDREAESVRSTLLISPPRAGKTTVLRDLVRQLSDGRPDFGWPGGTVGVVDERSELAGAWRGVPQHPVGLRTDVLDNCPKAVGLMMLIRSMGPQIVAVDELGDAHDAAAVREAAYAGITVLATAHARNLHEASRRPGLGELLQEGCFQRVVVLSRRRGPATVEQIHALDSGGVSAVHPQTACGRQRVNRGDVAWASAQLQPRTATGTAP